MIGHICSKHKEELERYGLIRREIQIFTEVNSINI